MRVLRIGAALLVVGAVTSGCARRWSRPGATEMDFYRDQEECIRATTPRWSFCTGAACMDQGIAQKDRWDRCMKLHGWHPGSRKLGGEAFDG